MSEANEKPPVVSICCITYNQEQYIQQAIDGFVSQKTDFPLEIIIHDDCSTDRTPEIIRENVKKYPGLIRPIFQRENQMSKGLVVLPFALREIRGKYIALCDGDDYWCDPLKLQEEVGFLEKNPDCVMVGTYAHIEIGGKREGVIPAVGQYPFLEKRPGTVEDCLKAYYIHTSTMVARNIWKQALPDWYERSFNADWAFAILHSLHGNIGFLPRITSVNRRVPGGIWTGKNALFTTGKIVSFFELLAEHLPEKHQPLVGRLLSGQRLTFAWLLEKEGRPKEAKEQLWKIWKAPTTVVDWPKFIKANLRVRFPGAFFAAKKLSGR